MPFVQGATDGIEGDQEKLVWIAEKCEVLSTLFESIVTDNAMIEELNKELFWKNTDTCMLLLLAFKS